MRGLKLICGNAPHQRGLSHLRITVSSDAAGLRAAKDFVDRFAAAERLPDDERAHLHLLVEELLTNLGKYGYDLGGAGQAELALCRDRERVMLAVIDDGRAFDPLAAPPPDLDQPVEDRPIGGLGLHLIRSLAEDARYERIDGRNHLTLTRRMA
jgi:serine/threonine-protein kinase RsbW